MDYLICEYRNREWKVIGLAPNKVSEEEAVASAVVRHGDFSAFRVDDVAIYTVSGPPAITATTRDAVDARPRP